MTDIKRPRKDWRELTAADQKSGEWFPLAGGVYEHDPERAFQMARLIGLRSDAWRRRQAKRDAYIQRVRLRKTQGLNR